MSHLFGEVTLATRFCEEIWSQNPAEIHLIRIKGLTYKDVGKAGISPAIPAFNTSMCFGR